MSWDSYVQQLTSDSELISTAAVYGHDGLAWASSPNFNLERSEVESLVQAFGPKMYEARSQGIKLQGQSYIVLRSDDKSIYAKRGGDGFIAVKTNLAVLLGLYRQPAPPGGCALVVERLADYMRSVNY